MLWFRETQSGSNAHLCYTALIVARKCGISSADCPVAVLIESSRHRSISGMSCATNPGETSRIASSGWNGGNTNAQQQSCECAHGGGDMLSHVLTDLEIRPCEDAMLLCCCCCLRLYFCRSEGRQTRIASKDSQPPSGSSGVACAPLCSACTPTSSCRSGRSLC